MSKAIVFVLLFALSSAQQGTLKQGTLKQGTLKDTSGTEGCKDDLVSLLQSHTKNAEYVARLNCTKGQAVDCDVPYKDSLLLFTSSGFGTYAGDDLVPEPCNQMAFRELILELPDNAWESGGAAKKRAARQRDLLELASKSFFEPELYSGLSTVVLEDTCYLKESFWNNADPSFSIPMALTYEQTDMATDVELVKPFFGKLLDGYCVNYSMQKPGFLGGLGFDSQRIQHVSLFDRLANDSTKSAVFELITTGKAPSWLIDVKADMSSAEAKYLQANLSSAAVLVINGGSPDFGKYTFMHFAPEVMNSALEQIEAGNQVYNGQSAGSMVMAASIGLTYDPPYIFEELLKKDTKGEGFGGRCAIRPHDNGEAGGKWDLEAAVYGSLNNLTMARLMNGQGLKCAASVCQVVGGSGRLASSVFTGPSDPNLRRLTDVFEQQRP